MFTRKKDFFNGNENNIQPKLTKYSLTLGIINNTFKPSFPQKFGRNNCIIHWLSPFFYMKAKFLPLEKMDANRLTSFAMKFFQRTAGCTRFDHRRDAKMLEELKAEPVDEIRRRYKSDWPRHITRMSISRFPKIMLICRPNGRRRRRRPLKRRLDNDERGLPSSNTWTMMMIIMIIMMCCRWRYEIDCSVLLCSVHETLCFIIEQQIAVRIKGRPMFLIWYGKCNTRMAIILFYILFYLIIAFWAQQYFCVTCS